MSEIPAVTVGATTIVHRIEYKDSTERYDLISRICKFHPQGKKLVIQNEKGQLLYELSIEESIF